MFGLSATRRTLTAFAALTVFAAPLQAAEVNLRSEDGSIDLIGELIELRDGTYTIEHLLGPIKVPASVVDCFGDACPTAATEAPVAVSWDVSLWGERRAFTEHVEKLAELVAEKTDGQFTLEIDYGGLSPSRENLDGIAAGAFEMAQFCAGYHPEKNRAITVLELPFLGVETLEQEIAISRAVYTHPATVAEMAKWNATLLMPSPLPQYNLMGTGTPPMSLAGFQGMSVRATGGIGQAIGALGGTLVSIPAPQVEEAMAAQKVQAVSFAPHAHMAFGTIERGSWWTTNLNPGTVNCPVVVASDALAALPPEFREALTSSVDAALDHYVATYNGATMDAWGPALEENLIMEVTFSDEILSSINAAVATPAAATWITKNESPDLPAVELYKMVTGMIASGS